MVASRSISDYIDSEKPIKAFHDWEQSIIEAGYVIKYLSVENQIVLDPLMGFNELCWNNYIIHFSLFNLGKHVMFQKLS